MQVHRDYLKEGLADMLDAAGVFGFDTTVPKHIERP